MVSWHTRPEAVMTISSTLVILLMLVGVSVESAYGQIVTGEPRGSLTLNHGEYFEVGVKMQKDTSIQYNMKADTFLLFDIHSHNGDQIVTHSITESSEFRGVFVAPEDGDYYFLAENLGASDASVEYRVSLVENVHSIQYEDARFDVITESNSHIESVNFSHENKQILIRVETPYLTPGFVNVAIPRSLIDGPFTVGGDVTEYSLRSGDESSSVFVIGTPQGTSEISIVGTTVVPEVPFPILLLALTVASLLLIARFGLRKRIRIG